MDLKCLLVAIGAAIIGASLHYIFSVHLWPNRHQVYTWIFALRNHKKLGEPCQTDLVLNRDGYSLGYSFNQRCALWVSYIISKNSIGVDVERGDGFYADPDIPEEYRVAPEDFRNTGFDKGHLAPSASIDFSRRSNDQTFAMSNIALQDPKLNRQAWGSLEGIIRDWTLSKGKLAITTGPIYNKRPEKIKQIPIPKSFYKIIYSFQHQKAIGFILPNQEVKANQLWNHVKSIAEIEQTTGYTFFNKLSDNKQQILKAEIDLAWWQD